MAECGQRKARNRETGLTCRDHTPPGSSWFSPAVTLFLPVPFTPHALWRLCPAPEVSTMSSGLVDDPVPYFTENKQKENFINPTLPHKLFPINELLTLFEQCLSPMCFSDSVFLYHWIIAVIYKKMLYFPNFKKVFVLSHLHFQLALFISITSNVKELSIIIVSNFSPLILPGHTLVGMFTPHCSTEIPGGSVRWPVCSCYLTS